MIIPVNLGTDSYDIVLERGCIRRAGELLRLDRKVLVVTDDGVPEAYAQTVADQCGDARIETLRRTRTLRALNGCCGPCWISA